MQRLTLGFLVGLSLAGLTAALVACAEAPPADLDALTQKTEPTEPEEEVQVPAPEAPKQEADASTPVPDAAPPQDDKPFVPETCPRDEQKYIAQANGIILMGGSLPECPCGEGECCVQSELLPGIFTELGCVEK